MTTFLCNYDEWPSWFPLAQLWLLVDGSTIVVWSALPITRHQWSVNRMSWNRTPDDHRMTTIPRTMSCTGSSGCDSNCGQKWGGGHFYLGYTNHRIQNKLGYLINTLMCLSLVWFWSLSPKITNKQCCNSTKLDSIIVLSLTSPMSAIEICFVTWDFYVCLASFWRQTNIKISWDFYRSLIVPFMML